MTSEDDLDWNDVNSILAGNLEPGSGTALTAPPLTDTRLLNPLGSNLCVDGSEWGKYKLSYCNADGASNELSKRQTFRNATDRGQQVVLDGSGQCMTPAGYSVSEHNRIHAWPCDGNPAQRWTIGHDGKVRSGLNGNMCLGLENPSRLQLGGQLHIYRCDDEGRVTQFDDLYKSTNLITAVHGNKCIDAYGGNTSQVTQVGIWDCVSDAENQQWKFVNRNGQSVLQVGNDGDMCLQTTGARTHQGVDLHTWPCEESSKLPGGRFQIHANGLIESVDQPGMCVDVPGGNVANGTRLVLWSCSAQAANHRWEARDISTHLIASQANSQKCMDAFGGNPAAVTAVGLWSCSEDAPNHQWEFTQRRGQPVLRVGPLGNDMCLQTSRKQTHAGVDLHTWPCEEASKNAGGRFKFNGSGQIESADQPGMCVDVPGGNTADGTRLVLWSCHSGAHQKWSLAGE